MKIEFSCFARTLFETSPRRQSRGVQVRKGDIRFCSVSLQLKKEA